jgi:hypothetical protein
MTDLSITDTDVRVDDRIFELNLIAGEAIDAGENMYINPSTGKWALFVDTVDDVEVYFADDSVLSGRVLKGYLECTADLGAALAGLNFNVPVYASDTAGKFADAGGAVNEVQTATLSGSPTGGTFTITFDGEETTALAFDITAADFTTAMEVLDTIGTDNIVVTGSTEGPYTLTFIGRLAGQDVPLAVGDGASLTGGSTPAMTVTVATTGVAARILAHVVPVFNNSGGTPSKLLHFDGRQ